MMLRKRLAIDQFSVTPLLICYRIVCAGKSGKSLKLLFISSILFSDGSDRPKEKPCLCFGGFYF